ncbi:hypothetical protein X798_07914 [Onchocerca flexuosa]|uniref:Uncharacterized protein n=1 Tax=Onchocerca flexuosa TaxID=387005 RepID=A0A238BI36_9BILA|nr:hypothetical protein X798_07914 [Onchocerca flexuosa]
MKQEAALDTTKANDLANSFSEFFKAPQILHDLDEVILMPLAKGHATSSVMNKLIKSSCLRFCSLGCWLFRNAGLGGSTIIMDVEEKLVIAYVSNGLKTGVANSQELIGC